MYWTKSCASYMSSSPSTPLQNHERETALHCAAQYGHTDVVTVLLQELTDPTMRNSQQETPLDLAALYGRLQVSHKDGTNWNIVVDDIIGVPDKESLCHFEDTARAGVVKAKLGSSMCVMTSYFCVSMCFLNWNNPAFLGIRQIRKKKSSLQSDRQRQMSTYVALAVCEKCARRTHTLPLATNARRCTIAVAHFPRRGGE